MITEELKVLVQKEADNLKKYATAEELTNLNFDYLDPYSFTYCIYGQMTGHCTTKRAVELLNLCAVPYSDVIEKHRQPIITAFRRLFITDYPFSPIEFYICQPEANNANLIDYLKGETSTLSL